MAWVNRIKKFAGVACIPFGCGIVYLHKNYWTLNENDVKSNGKKLKPVKVSIEGNIGSGKSTLLERFKEHSDVEVILEPIKEWQNVEGENLLKLSKQARWSYLFQSYALLTLLQNHKKKQNHPVTLMERSVYSCCYCFVENDSKRIPDRNLRPVVQKAMRLALKPFKKMSDAEHKVSKEWFDWVVEEEKPQVDLIVYLRTSPEVCYERIQKRGRKEDEDNTLDFLKAIHQRHEDWLEKMKFKIPARVLFLDGNKGIEDIHQHCDKIIEAISEEQKKPI